MQKIPKLDLSPYLEIIWRRKWWIIVFLAGSVISGFGYFKTAPKFYKANTLILVEGQKVPDSYVEPLVNSSLESRLQTITQQIHSRTNLEEIINKFNIKSEPKGIKQIAIEQIKNFIKSISQKDETQELKKNAVSIENLVRKLRENIEVNLQGRMENQAFEITVVWNDSLIVAQVANAVAQGFIEENLNVREEIARGTTDFLEREAARIRNELENREKELENFKNKNMGMLPSELNSNINILNQLKEELNNLENSIDTEKQQLIMLNMQIKDTLALQSQSSGSATSETITEEVPISDLERLEESLTTLRLRYTEEHPDIVELKKKIEIARQEKSNIETIRENSNVDEIPREYSIGQPNTQIVMLHNQRQLAETRIQSYDRQIRELKKEINVYKERVEQTPQVEVAMTKILRDYETVRDRYRELLRSSLNARMAEELEKRHKAEQFRVLDPAVPPSSPFSPDFKKIMLMAIAAGMAMGGGLAYLREMMDPCFYNPNELESELNTNVIVSLPWVKMK